MKKLNQIFLVGLLALMFMVSCSAEKRQYRSGYHISWLHSKKGPAKHELATVTKREKINAEPVVTGNENATSLEVETSVAPTSVHSAAQFTLLSGARVHSKSFQPLKKMAQIEAAPVLKKKNAKKAFYDEGPSQIVALILCVLVGVLGVHRFYLGYTALGILMLLTLGGCGIWALVDLIRLITGDLKPMYGDYSETL